ncbi:hypothetical protein [Parasitella parasitica]|uniref:Uncharacterized protein n=1 Tax=Parasitella parasitica TaxID=35722 RepID=A0A0B7NRL2_9FUNG|nr:hypothetical protein [Parasitella parasitica]
MNANHHHRSRNNLVKSNSYHGGGQYHRHTWADAPQHSNTVVPPTKRISRATTMSTIMEKQHLPHSTISPSPSQPNHSNKKRNSSSSNRISALNLTDDDIPLALLAYKKGYTSMPPTNSNMKPITHRPSPHIHRNLSQSSNASMVKTKRPQPTSTSNERRKHRVPYQIKTNTDSSTSQSSTVVATPTIEKEPSEKKPAIKKKWFSSLRKLLSLPSKK